MKKRKDIIPRDTRYVPLTQQRYCCVPTCVQMIMLRNKIPLQSVELIAHHLDVVVPPVEGKLFWNVSTSKRRPPAGYGTRLNENLTANPMFKKLKIPLKLEWRLIDSFDSLKEFKEYLGAVVKNNQDVIICYDWGALFNTDFHNGHACVLDRVYLNKNEVRFIDPDAKMPKWRTVKIPKLYKAMQYHSSDKMGGCWEVKKTKK